MPSRSLRVHPDWIEVVNQAYESAYGHSHCSNPKDFAHHIVVSPNQVGLSIEKLKQFNNGEAVEQVYFQALCDRLGLQVERITVGRMAEVDTSIQQSVVHNHGTVIAKAGDVYIGLTGSPERSAGSPSMAVTGAGAEMPIKELRIVLQKAFPRVGRFAMMLKEELGKEIDDLSPPHGCTYPERLSAVIESLASEGELAALVRGARSVNPGNPDLRAFAAKWLVNE